MVFKKTTLLILGLLGFFLWPFMAVTSVDDVVYVDDAFYQENRPVEEEFEKRTLCFRGANATDLIWDGAGKEVFFFRQKIVVESGKTLTIQNMILDCFNSDKVVLGEGAKLLFGDNIIIELGFNEDLKTPWTFVGTKGASTLRGGLRCLNFSDVSGSVISVGPSVALNVENVHIYGLGGQNQSIQVGQSSVINLRNVDLNLAGPYQAAFGTLNIYGDVIIRGYGQTFTQSLDAVVAIQDNSHLKIESNLVYNYDANTKKQVVLVGETSRLTFESSTLCAERVGLDLSVGHVHFSGAVTFVGGSAKEAAIVFDCDSILKLSIDEGAIMDAIGSILYPKKPG